MGAPDQDDTAYATDSYRCKDAEEAGHLEYFCLASAASSKDAESAANYCLDQWITVEGKTFDDNNKQEYNPLTRHFTQLIWKGTGKFGCAVTEPIPGGPTVGQRALTCLFDPPGNQIIAFSPSLKFQQNVQLRK